MLSMPHVSAVVDPDISNNFPRAAQSKAHETTPHICLYSVGAHGSNVINFIIAKRSQSERIACINAIYAISLT